MTFRVAAFSLLSLSSLAVSCKTAPVATTKPPEPNLPRFHLNQTAYDRADRTRTSVRISVADQKARLLDADGSTLLETDVSTGKPGRETPAGTFRVLERLVDKRSNKYGQYVKADTKEVVVAKAWEHSGPRPSGTVYQGIAMPYWMRLTWDGVGMHVGAFNRGETSSFGCIRVLEAAQPYIYNKTSAGTKVVIQQSRFPDDSLPLTPSPELPPG